MTTRQLLTTLVVLVVIGLVAFALDITLNDTTPISPSPSVTPPVYCTMDARMCPDGSYVGRVPPNCEFRACPIHEPQRIWNTSIGQKVGTDEVSITPLEVIEDSRCPPTLECIQAGTVRVVADIAARGTYSQHILKLGEPLTIGDRQISLIEVAPIPRGGIRIREADYRFTFEIR